jgi:phosphate uptake regulator
METRKLQRVGGGTYTVSIPKEWATSRGLEAGTAVNLHTHLDGSIVVRSPEMDRGRVESIDVAVGDDPQTVRQLLRATQTAGFEQVTLVTDGSFSTDTVRAVRSFVRGFVGAELVDERDGVLVVRSLLDAADVSVRQSVVQLQFVALSVHGRATDSLTGDTTGDTTGEHEKLRERAAEADRLCEMVSRHLNRTLVSFEELDRLGLDRPALFDYYETAHHLGEVAAEGVTVGGTAARLSDPLSTAASEEFRDLADATRAVVDDASMAVLEQRDTGTICGIHERRETTRGRITDWLDSLHDGDPTPAVETTAEAVAVARSLDALRRTLDHGGAVADVALRSLAREGRLPVATGRER